MKEKSRALTPTAILFLLLIASAALRFYDLGAESLWNDEALPVIAWIFHKEYFEYYFGRMGSTRKVDLIAGYPENFPDLEAFLAGRQASEF